MNNIKCDYCERIAEFELYNNITKFEFKLCATHLKSITENMRERQKL